MTTNQIAYFSAKEQQRHNLVMERETGRHNVADESIRSEANAINASHFTRMDSETLRHNLATEQQAREQLNLGYAQLDLGNRQLAETQRHNYASESLALSTLRETAQHNRATEGLAASTLAETVLHNRETEKMQDELNGSIITANYAESNLRNKQASYYGQQTETSKKQASLYEAEMKLTQEKTLTQQKETKYKGAEKVSTIASNWGHAVGSILGGVTKVASMASPVTAATTSTLDRLEAGFYSQLEEY